jgi:hypothetical protein
MTGLIGRAGVLCGAVAWALSREGGESPFWIESVGAVGEVFDGIS